MKAEQYISGIREYSRIFVRELGLLNEKRSELGIGYTEGHILLLLREKGTLTSKAISGHLQVDKSLVSRLVNRLNREGFIAFASSPKDNRQKPAVLTAAGKEKVDQIDAFADRQVLSAISGLEEGQIARISEGFKIYGRALRSARIGPELRIGELDRRRSPAMEEIITAVSQEFGTLGSGGPAPDFAETPLYRLYPQPESLYLTIEHNGQILGGAGIAPLKEGPPGVCELQKMYLKKDFRGLGLGRRLIEECLERAEKLGYSKCYLETVGRMERARALYARMGFRELPGPEGLTGHHQSEYWMIRDLASPAGSRS